MDTKAKWRTDETGGGSFVAHPTATEGGYGISPWETVKRASLAAFPIGNPNARTNRGPGGLGEETPPRL